MEGPLWELQGGQHQLRNTRAECFNTQSLRYITAFSPTHTMLTAVAQDGGPGLPVGHQALWGLVWVGQSRSQAWGEYNTGTGT